LAALFFATVVAFGYGVAAPHVQAQSPDAAKTEAGAAPAAETPADKEEAPKGLFDGIFKVIFAAGLFSFFTFLLLGALSLTAAYLVFEHIMTIRASELMPAGLPEQVRNSLMAGNVADAESACREMPSFLSFVLLSGIAEIEAGWAAVEKALEDAVAEQSARLFRKIEYLSVIGNIAPMVGLFGTVTGIMVVFERVKSEERAAGASVLAEGIELALVTTAWGLVIAILSLGAFAIFRNRVDQFVAEAAYMAQHVFTPLKPRRWKTKSERPASVPAPTPPPAPSPSPPAPPAAPPEGGE